MCKSYELESAADNPRDRSYNFSEQISYTTDISVYAACLTVKGI